MNAIAMVMLKALDVAWPEAVTIEPKTDIDSEALHQLRNAGYVDLYDMWSNGDRRWTITKSGRDQVAGKTT